MGAGAVLGTIALVARFAPSVSLEVDAIGPPYTSTVAPKFGTGGARGLSQSSAGRCASGTGGMGSTGGGGTRSDGRETDAEAASPELRSCPPDMTLVDGDFCPNLSYTCLVRGAGLGCAEYGRDNHCHGRPEHRRYCVDLHEWPNRVGENPMVYVDWFEAKGLCAGVGKRLCRRSEWMLACEGPKRMPYPWGFRRHPSPCNIDRQSIDFDVGALINELTREEELARLWQADAIGTHPACVSSFGAFDMAGNVDEWTDDRADDPTSRHPSTLNGGYWGPVRNTCRLTTTSHGPDFKFYQVGFRCCSEALDRESAASGSQPE